MKRFDLLRVPKEIEIIGMDISELGGVSEEVYAKLRKDFGFLTPMGSPHHSTYKAGRSLRVADAARQSLNRNFDESEGDVEDVVIQKIVFNHRLDAEHEVGNLKYD